MVIEEIREQLDEINTIVENDVHLVVSPEDWHIYSKLRDVLDRLEILLEQNGVI